MKTLLSLPAAGELAREGLFERSLLVVAAPFAGSEMMLSLSAHLAQRGSLRVLDGGNRFNAYTVARELRRLNEVSFDSALRRIQVARAFTCHQVLSLLEDTQAQELPTLVIDLLDTFYDESVNLAERLRLAKQCVIHLHRLSQQAVVIVSLRPPRPPATDPTGLMNIIQDTADHFWFQESSTPEPVLRLF
jgi:hypothetical protein